MNYKELSRIIDALEEVDVEQIVRKILELFNIKKESIEWIDVLSSLGDSTTVQVNLKSSNLLKGLDQKWDSAWESASEDSIIKRASLDDIYDDGDEEHAVTLTIR